jgi:hypothetical protein
MHRRPGRAVAFENQTEQADDLAPIVGNPGSAPAGAAAAISSPKTFAASLLVTFGMSTSNVGPLLPVAPKAFSDQPAGAQSGGTGHVRVSG